MNNKATYTLGLGATVLTTLLGATGRNSLFVYVKQFE